jgi:hypothetical protein
MGKAFAEMPENDRTEEPCVELGFHYLWDRANLLEHLEYDIAITTSWVRQIFRISVESA